MMLETLSLQSLDDRVDWVMSSARPYVLYVLILKRKANGPTGSSHDWTKFGVSRFKRVRVLVVDLSWASKGFSPGAPVFLPFQSQRI